MIRISKKLTLAVGLTAVVAGLGTGVAFAAAENDTDGISPAGTAFTASSTNFRGTINGVPGTITCKNVSFSGTTPSTGMGPWSITNLSFTGCTASITTNNNNGSWQLTFIDAASDEGTIEGSGQTGDQLRITIPKAGARLTFSTFPGCTVTVAPSGPANITGTYDDVNTWTLSSASVPVSGSGCIANSFTLTATFKFTPNIQDVS